ncbi:hypothetical protein GALMADRAFT_229338 [Galerina marginata CBS 339.88]|uniref:Uncharacterized protein n=1 Tax=Galerina marginata (strain CBS 339.88) TaxID=685588 RepID=A0A067SVU5_GALM3|nr:hypothetical protein GALMADRAFT_229338 [Galerina marginata CBS 339.88]
MGSGIRTYNLLPLWSPGTSVWYSRVLVNELRRCHSDKYLFVSWNFKETHITYQKHDGLLHFTRDAWTSPNHRAYTLVTVHFDYRGEAICLILDVVEVAKSHSVINLAIAFAEVLKEFGISDKYYLRQRFK